MRRNVIGQFFGAFGLDVAKRPVNGKETVRHWLIPLICLTNTRRRTKFK